MLWLKECKKNEKIEVIYDSVVDEILGDEKGVNGIRVLNIKSNSKKDIPLKGVFLAIGHIPNTDIVKGIINQDEVGYILTDPKSTKTNIEGIFACGDCQDSIYRQAITAAGTGCMASIEAERWLETQNH